MRIAIYHGPLFRGPDGYETYGPFARYIHEFTRCFDEVVVLAPVATAESDYRGCPVNARNLRIVELPDFRTYVQAARHVFTLKSRFKAALAGVDVVNCRNTAPFGYVLYRLAKRRNIAFFYHFTSDPWEILNVGTRYRGAAGVLARFAYRLEFAAQKAVMRRTYSFVNGRLPYERLRRITDRIEPIISSTLTNGDFRQRFDFGLHHPARLLYVGYLKHMKGLGVLLDAVRELRAAGEQITLQLVGSGAEESDLRKRAFELGIADDVSFHGYVPMGPELNRQYDAADIFVFPSLSEGSPRVVLEAMAHALPVVSTRVGSVPDLIENERQGLIVPPGDAAAIVLAVQKFLHDEPLRRNCGTAAFEAVKTHSVEAFVGRLAQKAKQLVQNREAIS